MDADAESMRRPRRHAGVALDHAVLHLDGATHRVDDAAELDEAAVAGALDDAPVMRGDRRIDQIAAQRPEPRQRSLLVRPGEPAIADDIGDQDRSDLPRFRHGQRLEDAAMLSRMTRPRSCVARAASQIRFVILDAECVGELVTLAAARGRATRPDLKLGVCGERGGDPASIAFCEQAGLDYVSCSPFRIPIGRLAAAQAALGRKAASTA